MLQNPELHYLDNAATTIVAPEVADVINKAMREHWANPSSLYAPGARSEEALNAARAAVARTLGCKSRELYFTSCGSESNNMALLGAALTRRFGKGIVVSGFEHPSVQRPLEDLAKQLNLDPAVLKDNVDRYNAAVEAGKDEEFGKAADFLTMKIGEEGTKRKLSKRKDPELSLDYYRKDGYYPLSVREYLMTILNSNFEEWRIANPEAPLNSFEFTTEKMSNSGALFDLNKLSDVCKDVLVRVPASELVRFMKAWAAEFRPEILSLFEGKEDQLERILDLGRTGSKPRKDLVCASQIFEFIKYFFDDYFEIEGEIPENVSREDADAILAAYLETYDHADDQSVWFEKIRTLGSALGYAAKPKDYKKHPEDYKGHVGDVSTVIRLAVTGRTQSPDVWEIQQILGEERTISRIKSYAAR